MLTVLVESCPDIEYDVGSGQLLHADDFAAISFASIYPGSFKAVVYSGFAFAACGLVARTKDI